ncbi:MAG: glycogen-binding domain-containing protein [Candidatus Krumholzibacteriia bacterium]
MSCACRPGRVLAGGLAVVGLLVAWPPAAAADSGHGWLSAAAGAESDVTLDSSPNPAIVPGGPLLAFGGGLGGRWGAPRRGHLAAGAQGWYERFTGGGDRGVFSAALAAELGLPLDPTWSLRLGAGARRVADSARTEAKRHAGWGEAGVAWTRGRWRLELAAGAESRRYPDLKVIAGTGIPRTYSETQTTAGLRASVRLGNRTVLRAAGHLRRTTARDPLYATQGPVLMAGAETLLGRRVRLLLEGLLEERTYPDRPAGADGDRYRQAGLGLEVDLGPRWIATATVALASYTWPDGRSVGTHRWQAGLTRRFGGPARPGLPLPGDLPRQDRDDAPRAGQPVEFRVHAPGAGAVALAGDFNGWDPRAEPLQRAGGGWWRTVRPLPAGTHAYVYVVDGAWVTPPEAAATEPDGFGGRNGLLVVLP